MFLYGREIGLAVTVGASVKLAKLCPGKDLNRIGELLQGSQADTLESLMGIACVLSEAYEVRKAHQEPGHKANPLTMEELESLDMDEISELFDLVTETLVGDRETQVNAKPAAQKGSKKNAK